MNIFFTFNRKIADSVFVPIFMKTLLRPNHITALSLLSGLATGLMMSKGSRSGLLWGAFFLQLSFILDNCDGGVARLKNMRSASGMWFDLIADLIVDLSLWAGLAAGAVSEGELPRWAWGLFIMAVAGSLSHFWYVTKKRMRGETGNEISRTNDPFWSAAHTLSHDGDPSFLVWLLMVFLSPSQFLFLGTLYVHLLWLTDAVGERLRFRD